MFDADWRLKEYSFGFSYDEKGQRKEIASVVPDYKDIFDLSFEQPWKEGETYMRFWITCNDAPLYEKDGAVYFGSIKMKVNTEKMFQASRGLVSSGGKQDPVGEAFAAYLTEHYDEFANVEPAFARVKELAKAVALAKWLHEQNIPIEMGWVEECLGNSKTDTPKQVSAISHTETKEYRETKGKNTEIQTLTIHLHGGVDLSVKPKYTPGGDELSDLAAEVKKGVASNPLMFEVNHANKDLKAVVLPLTSEGEARWGIGGYVKQDGIRYRFDNQRVTEAVDEEGLSATFDYGYDEQMKEIRWSLGGGYSATAKRANEGDVIEVVTPDGNKVSYYYDTSEELNEVKMNGETYAHLNSYENLLEVTYSQYAEKFASDNEGRIVSYQLNSPHGFGVLNFDYDRQSNLAKISGAEIEEVAFVYDGDKLSAMHLPRDEIRYIYDDQTRLKEVTNASGAAIEYSYEGDELVQVLLTDSNLSARVIFQEGRVVRTIDFFGAEIEYEYSANAWINKVTDAQGWQASYEYDENGQLQEVNLPDGGRIEYEYTSAEAGQLAGINIYPRPGL